MKLNRRVLVIGLVAVMLFAIPASVFAGRKQIFKAYMTVDKVVNSALLVSPRGVGILGLSPGAATDSSTDSSIDDVYYEAGAHGLPESGGEDVRLSGSGGGNGLSVTIHGPAGKDETAPAVVTLCGGQKDGPDGIDKNPCNVFDGHLKISGTIKKEQITGISYKDFIEALKDGKLYIQVNMDGSPLIRGQFYELD